MTAPALELGDIFRLHGPAYLTTFGDSLSHEQNQALRPIAVCRTATLGGHVEECDRCGYRKIAYCSCRNRHCPKCHGQARARWLAQRAAELLPVEYFHVVFTLPQLVAPLALQNQRFNLWHSLPCRRRNFIANRSRPEASRCQDRLFGGPAYLGTKPSSSSAPPLRRSWRRARVRPAPLDFVSPAISLSGQSAQPSVPRQVRRVSENRF